MAARRTDGRAHFVLGCRRLPPHFAKCGGWAVGCGGAWRTMNWRTVEGLAARGRELKHRGHYQRHQGVGVARGIMSLRWSLKRGARWPWRASDRKETIGLRRWEQDERMAADRWWQGGRMAADCWRQGGRRGAARCPSAPPRRRRSPYTEGACSLHGGNALPTRENGISDVKGTWRSMLSGVDA